MRFDENQNEHNFQSNENSPDVGAKIALWGTIAIQESAISAITQQQELDKLQAQIDDLKKDSPS